MIASLREAGVPVGVLVAPVIPMITDMHLEQILEAARDAGAQSAGYVLLRLPHELKAVSYTHLDVYKRQSTSRALVCSIRGPYS